jgi:aspartate kinase
MVVLKFGGTSVADRAAVTRLVDIVQAVDGRPVVVVSALGGATDRLLALAAQAGAGDRDGARDTIRQLQERHIDVAGVIGDETRRADVTAFLEAQFDELARVIDALSVLRDTSPRWLDNIAAVGEICSSRIVAAALSDRGRDASWVDARRALVTSDDYMAAIPLMPETTERMRSEVYTVVEAGRVPVLGGFVGATLQGVTTTLGRGGSDYSAAIVGACLDAREIQIWTDVDGMLTADPRLVPDARLVPALSFGEASELAFFGAKVLHPSTILPAMTKNIPVRILNSRNATAPGTMITATRATTGQPLTAVASKRNVTVVDIASTRMLAAHGFLHRLFGVFETHATSVDVVTTSEVSVSVTVDDVRRLPGILADLREFADATREDQMAVLCVVGEGLAGDPAFLGRLVQALGPVPIRMLSQAAERRNITLVIPDAELPAALRRVHDEFFVEGPDT